MVKMKVLPEPSAKMVIGTEIIDVSDEAYNKGYDRGFTEGEAKGKAEGIEQGKQAEYDRFWDAYQENGTRTNYQYMFNGNGWTDETFKPKYPLKPMYLNRAFEFSKVATSPYLKEIDFSICNAVVTCFKDSAVEELGVVDCANVQAGWNGLTQMFYNATRLRSIEKLIFPKSSMSIDAFGICNSLEEVTFEGTAYRTIQLHWSKKLSVASMKSLISCLYNHTGTSTEFTYTVKFAEECWAALEADSTAPDGGTWRAYVNSLGWNT